MAECPYCHKDAQEGDVKCRHCGGWFTENADARQAVLDKDRQYERLLGNREAEQAAAPGLTLFYVPTRKFILLYFLSFSCYELYWFFRNWRAFRAHEQSRVSPFWRSVFSVLFCYNLFRRLVKSAQAAGHVPRYSAGPLAALYIAMNMTFKLPSPLDMISLFGFIPLVLFNPMIAHINKAADPSWTPSHRLNTAEICWIVFGLLIWASIIYGMVFGAS